MVLVAPETGGVILMVARRPHGHSAHRTAWPPWDGGQRDRFRQGQMAWCVGAVKATIPTGGERHRLAAVAVVVYRNGLTAQFIPAGRAVIVRVPYLRALEDVVGLVATLVLGVAGAVVYPQVEGDGASVIDLVLRRRIIQAQLPSVGFAAVDTGHLLHPLHDHVARSRPP